MCCGDENQNPVITPIDPSVLGTRFGCCLLADGTFQTFDTRVSACCGDRVQPLDPSVGNDFPNYEKSTSKLL